ncbi:MAG: ribonuclease HII [Acidimicrobiales bacterium]|jgi:ribonuclease HII|nr:ribonuclease HII [Acidimicrobiales bacterium]MDP7258139.1 ribonuclease HII [Acidimicrobiales bacterium]HJO79408.1 ribonuclease HII [Acidimicrobiales bacterium]|tara:strand:+ start:10219 stop:10899 length:681 start_codon:yes stop_codon:yes gene_type:complete
MRAALRGKAPGLAVEKSLWAEGYEAVVGMDEVGRGAWAGPLTVGAVLPNKNRRIMGVRDSKMLTEPEREALYNRVTTWAEAWAVGHATNDECDELGMSVAQRLAAHRALECLGVAADRVLLDGRWDFVGGGIAQTIVGGDATSLSIAAASVVAKVTRDRLMREADGVFPGYGFADGKGYPSPVHRSMLMERGATSFHRRSWSFMDDLPDIGEPRRRPADSHPKLFE